MHSSQRCGSPGSAKACTDGENQRRNPDYTMYVGTPAQETDFAQFHRVREDALRWGTPLIVWAYPRGSAIEAKGGKNSFYAVDYAARTASELGADVSSELPPP
jgi:hypothetical protein